MHQTILVDRVPEKIKDVLKFDKARQRYFFYMDKLEKGPWITSNYSEDDNKICYSESQVSLKMGAALYLYRTSKKGFTYDKQTKKITMWFGSIILKMIQLDKFLIAINKEWTVNEGFSEWITKTLLEHILSNKITNPKQACKFILKQSRIECSIESLRYYIKRHGSKAHLLSLKDAVLNINVFLEDKNDMLRINKDLVQQAKALNRKFDLTWSKSRLETEHQNWTRELMSMEINMIEDYKVEWPKIKLPDNMELLASKRRVFEEGNKMRHCIFTNYWEQIKAKKYLALHVVDDEGNEATAGIRIGRTRIQLDDVLSKRNEPASEKIIKDVNKLLKSKTFLSSVKINN